MPNLKVETFRGLFWLLAGNGVQTVLKIVVLAILARILDPSDFGVIAVSLILLGLTQLLIQLGVGPAIVQKKDLVYEHLCSGFVITVLLSILFSASLMLFRDFVAAFLKAEALVQVIPIICGLLIFKSLGLVQESYALKQLKFKELALIEMFSYVIGYSCVAIILALLGYKYQSVIYAVAVQEIMRTSLIIKFFEVKKDFKYFKKEGGELLNFGFGNTLGKAANYFANQLDQIAVSRFTNMESLGLYSRGHQLGVMPSNIVGSSVNKVLFSSFSTIQDKNDKLLRSYYQAYALASLVAFPVTLIFFFQADLFVALLLGENWVQAVPLLQLFSLAIFLRLANKINDSTARALGIVYKRALVQIIFAMCVGVGSFSAVQYGLEAVIWTVNISLLINFAMMSVLLAYNIGTEAKDFFRAILGGLNVTIVVGLLMALSEYYIFPFFESNIIKLFVILSVLTVAVASLAAAYPKLIFKNETIFVWNMLKTYMRNKTLRVNK